MDFESVGLKIPILHFIYLGGLSTHTLRHFNYLAILVAGEPSLALLLTKATTLKDLTHNHIHTSVNV